MMVEGKTSSWVENQGPKLEYFRTENIILLTNRAEVVKGPFLPLWTDALIGLLSPFSLASGGMYLIPSIKGAGNMSKHLRRQTCYFE